MPEIVRDRDELLLNAIATGDATDIDPRDREEKFLKAIANKIGSGGGAALTKIGHYSLSNSSFTIDGETAKTILLTASYTDLDGNPIVPEDSDLFVFGQLFTLFTDYHLMIVEFTADPKYAAVNPTKIVNLSTETDSVMANAIRVNGSIYRAI